MKEKKRTRKRKRGLYQSLIYSFKTYKILNHLILRLNYSIVLLDIIE